MASWETYTDDDGFAYYYDATTGVSTYDKPADFGSTASTPGRSTQRSTAASIEMVANPMMSTTAGGKADAAGATAGARRSSIAKPLPAAEVQMGDLVDVDRTGTGRSFERAKVIAIHLGDYEVFRDNEGYIYFFNEATGDNTYDRPSGSESQTVDVQFRADGAIQTGVASDRVHAAGAEAHTKGERRTGWCRRNWVLVLLFGVGLFGILFALLCFLEPCAESTVTKTIETPYFVDVLGYENVTTVSNVTTKNEITTIVPVVTTTTIVVVNPSDLYFMLDASGSMGRDDSVEQATAVNEMISTYHAALLASVGNDSSVALNFRVGAMQFGDENVLRYLPPAQADFRTDTGANRDMKYMNVHRLTTDIAAVQTRITDVGDIGNLGMGTNFAPPLIACAMSQGYAVAGSEPPANMTKQKICILCSDGGNQDNGWDYESGYAEVYAFCQTNNIDPCEVSEIRHWVTSVGHFKILGIFVGYSTNGDEKMYKTSSCVDTHGPYSRSNAAACPWFISATDFANLRVQANALANTLAGTAQTTTTTQQAVTNTVEVTTQEETTSTVETTTVAKKTKVEKKKSHKETSTICTTDNGACWLWLLLFLPLLVYLLWRPCSIIRARRKKRFNKPPVVEEAPVAPVMAPVVEEEEEEVEEEAVAPASPPPAPVEKEVVADPPKQKGKYKWALSSAENYIWTFQGGARPMFVDKGKHEKSKWHTAHEAMVKGNLKRTGSVGAGGGGGAASPRGRHGSVVAPARRRQTVVEPRQATYDLEEIQPGDIDYEYTMLLMKCCPCLRPPAHPMDDMDDSDWSDDEDDEEEQSTPTSTKKNLRSIMSSQEMDVPGARGAWQVVNGVEGKWWWNKVSGETTWEDPHKQRGRSRTAVSVV